MVAGSVSVSKGLCLCSMSLAFCWFGHSRRVPSFDFLLAFGFLCVRVARLVSGRCDWFQLLVLMALMIPNLFLWWLGVSTAATLTLLVCLSAFAYVVKGLYGCLFVARPWAYWALPFSSISWPKKKEICLFVYYLNVFLKKENTILI